MWKLSSAFVKVSHFYHFSALAFARCFLSYNLLLFAENCDSKGFLVPYFRGNKVGRDPRLSSVAASGVVPTAVPVPVVPAPAVPALSVEEVEEPDEDALQPRKRKQIKVVPARGSKKARTEGESAGAGVSELEWTEQQLEHALQIASHIETPLGPAPKRPGKEPALPSSGATSRREREVISSLPPPPPLPSSGSGGRGPREGSGDSRGAPSAVVPDGQRKSSPRDFIKNCQNALNPAALNRVLFEGIVKHLDL